MNDPSPQILLLVNVPAANQQTYGCGLEQDHPSSYQMVACKTALEALQWCQCGNPVVVLLDCSRSFSAGLEWLQEFQSDPKAVHAAVIGLVRPDDAHGVIQLMRSGAQDCLIKTTFTTEQLHQRIHQALTQRKQVELATHQRAEAEAELERRTTQLETSNQNLQTALEEVRISQEELRIQNEDLLMANQAAEVERQRYEDLFDFAPHAYLVSNANGLIQEANRAATCWLATKGRSLIGKPLLLYIPAQDHLDFSGRLQQVQQAAPCKQVFELTLQPQQGDAFPAEITATAIQNAQGQIIGVRWLIQNIGDRKHLEAELKQTAQDLRQLNRKLDTRVTQRTAELQASEAKLLALTQLQQAILDSANYSIISTLPDGTIQTFNAAAQTMLGYTPQEVINQTSPERLFHDPDELQQQAACLSAELGQPITPDFGALVAKPCLGITTENEWTYIRKDGTRFPVMLSVTALRHPAGEIWGYLGIARDVTQQKYLEAQLRRNAAHLVTAQRIAHLGSWELDLPTQKLTWSEEVFRIFGRNPEWGPPTYDTFLDMFLPQDRDRCIAIIQQAIDQQQSREVEVCFYYPDGQLHHVVIRCEVIADVNGTAIRLLGTVLDISDRKQAEEQLRQINEQLVLTNAELARATRLKDEFLANMSHELRTPLTSILGMSDMLVEEIFGALNEKQHQYLGVISQSGRHLLTLINDILDLAKIESGKLELQIEVASVQELCASSLAFVQQTAHRKKIQLDTYISPHVHDIHVDAFRIRQALINLLSNAVKFTPDGGRVGLEVERDRFQNRIQFSVVDTGIGIDSKDMPKLFQSFVQIDSSLSRQYGGTGLGLALVKQIVELHHGQVDVASTLGQGSRFTLYLPEHPSLSMEHDQAAATALPSAPRPQEHTSPTRSLGVQPLILLAEDNQANIDTFSNYLSSYGYRVQVAMDGQEAIDQAQQLHPDVILMDVQMPGIDGLEATRQIRNSPDLAHTPIIALTALAMTGDRDRCLAAGATDYLMKPVRLKQLLHRIKQLCQQSEDYDQSIP